MPHDDDFYILRGKVQRALFVALDEALKQFTAPGCRGEDLTFSGKAAERMAEAACEALGRDWMEKNLGIAYGD